MPPSPRLAALFAAAVMTGALLAPSAAMASPSQPWKLVRVGLSDEGGNEAGLLVSGDLDDGVELPREVSLSVPKGTRITWVGEILGGAASADPSLAYRVEQGPYGDLVVFTLKKGRRAQVEGYAPDMLRIEPRQRTMAVEWTSPSALPAVEFGVQLPAGTRATTSPIGLQPVVMDDKSLLYLAQRAGVEAGERFTGAVTYATASSPPAVPATRGDSDSLVLTVLLTAIAIVTGLFYGAHRRRVLSAIPVEESE